MTTADNVLKIFQFHNHNLRIFPDDNGAPWFIAIDVAEILEYSDAYEMTKKLDEDEVQNRLIAGFGNRGVNLINESGLYSTILTSQKSEAKTFKRWITREVLPSIRKTGSFIAMNSKHKVTSANKAFNMIPGAVRAAQALGLNPSEAIMHANRTVAEITGVDVIILLKIKQDE